MSVAHAQSAEPCALPRELLAVTVGASSRGEHLVLRNDNDVWVEGEALRDGEEGYAAERAACGTRVFVRLAPSLNARVDDEEQVLRVTPTLALLGRYEVQVEPALRALPGDGGVLVVPLSLKAYAQEFGGRDLQVALSARPRYEDGPFSLDAAVAGGWSGVRGFSGAARGSVAYRAENGWVFSALLFEDARYGRGALTGARAAWVTPLVKEAPPIQVEAPLEATAVVTVGGRLVQQLRLKPGVTVLRGVPINTTTTEVLVEVRDASGTREQRVSIPRPAGSPASGTGRVTLEGGWASGAWYAGVGGAYGLSPEWSVEGSAALRGPAAAFRARLNYASTPWFASGALSVGDGLLGGGVTVRGEAGARTSGWTWRASGEWRSDDLTKRNVSLDARWNSMPWQASGAVTYNYALDLWSAEVAGGYRVPSGWSVEGAVKFDVNVAKFTVRASVPLTSQSSLDAVWSDGVGVTWTQAWDDATRTQVGVAAGVLRASLERQGVVDVSAALDSRGTLSGGVSGSVARAGGQWRLTSSEGSGGVLVRTGVPNVPVRLNEVVRGSTDASGEVLLTGLAANVRYALSVAPDALPINVSVVEDRVEFELGGAGLHVLDWTANFRVSRWVTLRWRDGRVAAGGRLVLGDEEVWLDEAGRGLVFVPERRDGVLEVAGERCAVRLDPELAEARCLDGS
ncbi:outer membrane usher protein FimD/PapC [Deinococcus yavapaiensis KR-236]|uniref:Outer membrane usher protein FimD/PapC n=1 Tax=Deinococcus yavapaiensis KR-236 TaxID=694435 RepID=A0A318SKZ9_9DEIO|nr:outer membrane usher protein FimD/PapC [Deinococcus yavapaiensis KR-236]